MNDQLSHQLRRHFVESAAERPASGQLDSVLRLTATQPQQASWLVRLRWLVSPAAPFANAGVRLALVFAAVVLALGAVVILGGGDLNGPAPGTPFEGTWTSTDAADDSAQTLIVGSGSTPHVQFEDDYSMNCDAQGDPSTVYTAEGPGQIEANRLIAHFPSGGCGTWQVGPADWFYDFDAATDTLLDYNGTTWQRMP